MSLNLRQIEVFRAIMVTGSVSGAAKLLNVSQPAISRLLSHMESRSGLTLFERIKGRLYPTPEARTLFTEVDAVYQRVQRVNEITRDLVEKRQGTLRLAVIPSLGQTLIPMAISRFRQQFPHVKIILHTVISNDVFENLLSRHVEVGVVTSPANHPNLHARPIFKSHLVAVLPASHPLTNRPEIHTQDLLREDLIGYGADTPLGRLTEQMFSSVGGMPRLAVEVRFTHMACAMVQAGAGVGIADELAVMGRIWPDVVVRPIVPTTVMSVNVLHYQLEPLSLLVQDFIHTLETTNYHSLRMIE